MEVNRQSERYAAQNLLELSAMAIKSDTPGSSELLRVLARWNRWGEARLDPGVPRRLTGELSPFLHTSEVVALIGPRRAGKTTVLYQVMEALEKSGVPREGLLHLNLEEPALAPGLGPELLESLYRTYRAEVFPEGRAYVFLDEIQRVPEWERWVRARNESEDVKIFVTGSSAALMAPELATLLTGRHVTFRVLPLSFPELLRFQGIEPPEDPRLAGDAPRLRHALTGYLRWGGFPEVVLAEDERRKEVLLKQYFDDILFKDVALRHRLRDLTTLRNLAVHLLGQTAGLVSFQRLTRVFGVSLELARTYTRHLEEAFLVSFLPFYTLKTAEQIRRPRKVHAVDLGLRNAVCLTGAPDRGRLMETAVHNALATGEHDGLFYWKNGGEVDLVLRRGIAVQRLIQVTDAGLGEPAARERELRPLAEAQERFEGAEALVVAGQDAPGGFGALPPGVRAVPLWRFLLAG
jgi:predicted AAA+ superfamily ATPase